MDLPEAYQESKVDRTGQWVRCGYGKRGVQVDLRIRLAQAKIFNYTAIWVNGDATY